MSSSYRVASYNLLHEQSAQQFISQLPENLQSRTAWRDREQDAIENVKQLRADILCVQECTRDMYKNIPMQEAVFAFHKNPSNPNSKHYHGVAILFNPQRFTPIQGTRKTIYSENGKATVVSDLQDNITQKTVRVASAHLNGGPNRDSGDRQLVNIEKTLADRPDKPDTLILAGDFNEDIGRVRSGYLNENGIAVASSQNPTEPRTGRHLDWIAGFGQATLSPECTSGCSDLASDHLPALVTVEEISSQSQSPASSSTCLIQ